MYVILIRVGLTSIRFNEAGSQEPPRRHPAGAISNLEEPLA